VSVLVSERRQMIARIAPVTSETALQGGDSSWIEDRDHGR